MLPLRLGKVVFERLNRALWLVAWLFFVLLLPIVALWGGPVDWMVGLVYAISTILGWVISRSNALWGITFHLLVSSGLTLWYIHQPGSIPQRLGNAEELYVSLIWPSVTGWAMLWGIPGALISVLVSALATVNPTIPERVASSYVLLFAGIAGLCLYYLIRETAKSSERLAEDALQDPLTGLGNRRILDTDFRRFRSLAERAKVPLMVTVWDLDGLKEINDTRGHAAGDEYIRTFATLLKRNVREGDGVYRIGGDEFAGLHIGLEDARNLVRRVRTAFPRVSVGWANSTENLDESLSLADNTLYAEKNQRKISKN
jgi:diguanylate cyclase (GGDEF)-like protein